MIFKIHNIKIIQFFILFFVSYLTWTQPKSCHGTEPSRWLKNPKALKISLDLPTLDRVETLRPSAKTIEKRIDKSKDDERIEPLEITILLDENPSVSAKKINKFVIEFVKDRYRKTVTRELKKIQKKDHSDKKFKFKVTKKTYPYFKLDALLNRFRSTSHRPLLKTSLLRHSAKYRRKFLSQIAPFTSRARLQSIKSKVISGKTIPIDRELLPFFPKRMLGKYSIYRGLNCFHASLAFHDLRLTQSRYFNVNREKGYHQAMINYDELWRTLNTNFYEVKGPSPTLKFGDILIFFDLPKNKEHNHVYFRWIRHAAVYLISGYTFSKGSKSANSTYAIKTIGEEWKTWQRHANQLAIKIFRSKAGKVRKHPPKDLVDWIY